MKRQISLPVSCCLSFGHQVHKKAAESLLDLCCANRGVFVKVGQHIGALEYILPHEYVETMKVLHSQAPTSSFEEVLGVLRQDLQCDVSSSEYLLSCIYTSCFVFNDLWAKFLLPLISQETSLRSFHQHLLALLH